ncbi:MAG: hypothetical protein HYX62_01390 [Gammaproteobacteria bacterium]|nr:hypothetical protein [Gammaproteobacteria bacterium]
MRQATTVQHTGTHQREGTRSHAFPIARRRACVPGRIVSLTRRGDKNGDGTIAPSEFDTANLAYDSLVGWAELAKPND